MNEIREIRQNPADIQYDVSVIRYELKFRKLMRAIKAGFNRLQPRDERGRWTAEGGIEVTTFGSFLTGIPTIDNTSEALSNILTKVMATLEYLPELSTQNYGKAVHAAFGLRAEELRAKTRAAPNTPVLELNVVRGVSRKYDPARLRAVGSRLSHRARLNLGRL